MVVEKKLYTVEAFEAYADAPEQRDKRRLELVHGEMVEMSPTELHGLIAGNLYFALRSFVAPRNLGRVVIEVRYRHPDDPHNARIPDVAFTTAERLLPVSTRGSVPQMPDLAVEVKSPDDTYKQMRATAAYYLDKGVRLVWLVFPEKGIVEVYAPDRDVDILLEKDDAVLDGGDLLPGFALPLRAVFAV